MNRALASVTSVVVTSWPLLAAAQAPTAKASAVQLFDEADRLMLQGNVSEACPKYAASMKLDPQLGALLHLADCLAKNGQVASAWASFRDAEELARLKNDDRAVLAREQAILLEPRLSRLTVLVPQPASLPGLEVRVDGVLVTMGAWGVATPIDPGLHSVEARAAGYESWSSSFDVSGETQQVRVEIPVLIPEAPAPVATRAATGPVNVHLDDQGSPVRTLGWVGIGVGAASLGLGAVFLVQKGSKVGERDRTCPSKADCSEVELTQIDSLTSDARTADMLSTAGFVLGGVLVAGGIAAVIFAPKSKARMDSAWLVPALGPGTLGLAGGATF